MRLTRRAALATLAAAGLPRLPAAALAAPNRLRFAWPSNAGPLNPHLYAPNQMFAQQMLYEPLVRYRAGGRLEPWLAEAWEVSPDGRAYTFRLREGVRFSDGHPFDAEAVRLNVEAVLANRRRHAWLEMVAQIEGVEVLDPRTVRIRLRSSYYPFLQDISLVRPLRFLSPAAMPASGNTSEGIKAAVGTGPWLLVESRPGERDLFRRNEAYWGPKPAYDEILVQVLPDPTARALALEADAIDMAYGVEGALTPDATRRLKASGRFEIRLSEPVATRTLVMNATSGVTADIRVRQAIQRALDRKLMVETVLAGLERPAEALFASNLPYADWGLTAPAHDVAEASRLLDAAGWRREGAAGPRRKEGKPLAIELCFVGNDGKQKALAEVTQAALGRLGMTVTLKGEEASSLEARMRDGSFGMVFSDTWGPPYDPHAFASSMRAPSHADFQAQRGLPEKSEIDRRIGAALAATDEAERAGHWRWVLTALHEAAVYLPISYKQILAVTGPRVEPAVFGATVNEIPFERFVPADPRRIAGRAP